MSAFTAFFSTLLREGRAVLEPLPPADQRAWAELVDVLRRAYADHSLEVAGPPLEFDGEIALAAARLVHQACWALVSHARSAQELAADLVMPAPPLGPAQHLSADLLLRHLPQIHLRARARDPGDPLVPILEDVLRRWPLSGVLADIEEGPLTPLDFGGHAGLLLLYAERLARHERPAWFPTGAAREYVQLVWSELGKEVSPQR